MRYLKVGLRGPDIEAWANFLIGIRPCSSFTVGDIFTETVSEETKIFQRAVGLDPDGTVGPLTMAEAMKVGFNPMIDDDNNKEDSQNWPPKPEFGPLSYIDRAKIFGQFSFVSAPTTGNPEGIRIVGDWVNSNITQVIIPQLVTVHGAPKTGKIYFHKKATEQLQNMFQAWDDAALTHLILDYAGSWVPRFIRGSRSVLSNHAWGTAFDINVAQNYLGAQPALKGKRGSVRELVSIANSHGFFWGGHFAKRPDGMHFEVAKLL